MQSRRWWDHTYMVAVGFNLLCRSDTLLFVNWQTKEHKKQKKINKKQRKIIKFK
jgi:hypothetical protein